MSKRQYLYLNKKRESFEREQREVEKRKFSGFEAFHVVSFCLIKLRLSR